MNNAPIFILGCPRSGTALIRNLLRSHPRLTFPEESHFIPLFYYAYGDPQNDDEARRLASRILSLQWVKNWELEIDSSEFASCRSYREVISRLYGAWAQKENKPRWGDKTPQYVKEIPTLLELFPDCQIIHIIRDGRDVALSWVPLNFGPMNVLTAAAAWKDHVCEGRKAGSSLSPKTYMEIRYEDLLTDLKGSMERICLFLNESFTEEILKPTVLKEIHPQRIIGRKMSRRFSYSRVNTTNHGKWMKDMKLSDRALFESIAGDLMATLGYETEHLGRCITLLEKWKWRVHHYFWVFINRMDMVDAHRWLHTFVILKLAYIKSRYSSWKEAR